MEFGHGFYIPPLCCNSWFEILLKIFALPNSLEEQGVNRKHPVHHNKECKATIRGEQEENEACLFNHFASLDRPEVC